MDRSRPSLEHHEGMLYLGFAVLSVRGMVWYTGPYGTCTTHALMFMTAQSRGPFLLWQRSWSAIDVEHLPSMKSAVPPTGLLAVLHSD